MNAPTQTAHPSPLARALRQQCQQAPMAFASFMQQALYHPQWGYYCQARMPFGASGDFITAPEMGNLFAAAIGQHIAPTLSNMATPCIVEIGAGSGKLAQALIKWCQQQHVPLARYLIIEISPSLRQHQQVRLRQHCPDFFPNIEWHPAMPAFAIEAAIIANEVLDAMPVARFLWQDNTCHELKVAASHHGFTWQATQASNTLQQQFARNQLPELLQASDGYCSEINLQLDDWIQTLSCSLKAGLMLFCDYGFERATFYHPDRREGTLMCHYRHHSHGDPFVHLGQQDITAHVDFSHLAQACQQAGLRFEGLTSLANFILQSGAIDAAVAEHGSRLPHALQQEILTLTSPAEMGELFKIAAFAKGYECLEKPD